MAGLGFAAPQLAWQATRVDTRAPADCLAKFKSSRWAAWLILLGIVASKFA